MDIVPIKYIGPKPIKHDTINHTRTMWNGKGDVQPYPANLAPQLLVHTTIWVLGSKEELPDGTVLGDEDGVMIARATAPSAIEESRPIKSRKTPAKSARTLE